ncbi:MAG TPA: hypothetical protein VN493_23180 [Thermoanaerobaculia bacterium]|nr:hypothetical protein [Thermoanaerobaculia bacterium]
MLAAQHEIRSQLHPQLQDLCFRVPDVLRLVAKVGGAAPDWKKRNFPPAFQPLCEEIDPDLSGAALVREFNGVKFIPVIVNALRLACELDILFLRRELPGGLIKKPKDEYGGDIDNRLKVLFDALRPPENASGLPKNAQFKSDQKSMLCLLEDDALITKFQVESDTLLGIDLYETANPKDVVLVIRVTIKRTAFSLANMQFAE